MLFIFSLLIASVLSSPVDLFRESAAFLASMSEADPEVVKQMIALIEDIKVENQQDKDNSEKAAVESRNVADAKTQAHAERTSQFNAANKAFVTATGTKNQLTTLEATQRAVLEGAIEVRDDAQSHADKKEASLNKISARVHNEKKAFDEVLQLLEEVIVPENLVTLKRSLLNFDAANPDAVKAVQDQVKALIVAADKEVAVATDLHDKAQTALDAALAAHKSALDTHTETSGQLVEAIKDVAEKKQTRDNAHIAMREAEGEMTTAERQAVSDRKFADSEAERVAQEFKALSEAHDLLQSLL